MDVAHDQLLCEPIGNCYFCDKRENEFEKKRVRNSVCDSDFFVPSDCLFSVMVSFRRFLAAVRQCESAVRQCVVETSLDVNGFTFFVGGVNDNVGF